MPATQISMSIGDWPRNPVMVFRFETTMFRFEATMFRIGAIMLWFGAIIVRFGIIMFRLDTVGSAPGVLKDQKNAATD